MILLPIFILPLNPVMPRQHLSISRSYNCQLIETEINVRGFSRVNKSSLDTELRSFVLKCNRSLVCILNTDSNTRLAWIERLQAKRSDVKSLLQHAKGRNIFTLFNQLKTLSQLAAVTGKQVVNGRVSLHPYATNACYLKWLKLATSNVMVRGVLKNARLINYVRLPWIKHG